MGNGLERQESGISILGDLGEVCLFSKGEVTSAATDSKKVTRSLTISTSSFMGKKTGISIFPIEKRPCV